MEYVKFYTPGNEGESSFIESLLKAHRIRYYIQNEIGSRYVIGGLSYPAFYIYSEDLPLAQKVLDESTVENLRTGYLQHLEVRSNHSEPITLKFRRFFLAILRLISGE